MSTVITELVTAFTADTRDMLAGFDLADKKANAFTKTADNIGSALKVALGVGVAALAGFTAVVADSVGKAADMEQGIADIGATMVLTSDETAKLQDYIMDLGLDPHLKVSATEASSAVMSLGTAGLNLQQIMGGAAKSTVLLANATGLSGDSGLATAANIATDVMGQFNIKAADMDKAVNQIAGATIASKFTINDMALAYAQAGGVAGQVGVSFEDFNAIIASISPSFAGGSDAGTSFKVMLQRLTPTTDKAKEAMDQLNLRAADGIPLWYDTQGNFKGAEELARLLSTAFSGLSDTQKTEAASTIFGTDAMRAALSLAAGGIPIIEQSKATIGKVDAEELAAKRMDTFSGSMEIAQGIIETLSISVGQKFLPVLRPLVDTFSALAQTYGPAVIDFFGSVADTLGGALSGISTAIKAMQTSIQEGQNAWTAFKTLIANLVPESLFNAINNVISALQGIYQVVQAAYGPIASLITKFVSWQDVMVALGVILAGPVLAAFWGIISGLAAFLAPIAAVVAAVAALRWAWENDFLRIRTVTMDALDKISHWFYEESGIWKGNWTDTWAYIADKTEHFFKYDIYNFIVGTWAQIKYEWTFHTTIIRDRTVAWVGEITNAIRGWVGDMGQQFNIWRDKAIDVWHEWTDPTKKSLDEWVFWVRNKIEDFIGWFTGDIGGFAKMKADVIRIWDGMLGWWTDNIQPWINSGRDIVQGLWDGIRTKWFEFTGWWQGEWEYLKNRFKSFFGINSPSTVFSDFGSDMMAGLAQGLSNNQHLVMDAMGNIATEMKKASEWDSLGSVIGEDKAKDFAKKLNILGANASSALSQGNVAAGNPAYQWAQAAMNAKGTDSLATLKNDIDNLSQQLGEKGVGTTYGKATKTDLNALSDSLGRLMMGDSYISPYTGSITPTTPTTGTGTAAGTAVETLLKAILTELQKGGKVSVDGFKAVVGALANVKGGGLKDLVSTTNGLR